MEVEQFKTRKGRFTNDNAVNNKFGWKDDVRHKKKSDRETRQLLMKTNQTNRY